MYAGRIACCPLLSHGEYVDGTDRQTDRHQTVNITLYFSLRTVVDRGVGDCGRKSCPGHQKPKRSDSGCGHGQRIKRNSRELLWRKFVAHLVTFPENENERDLVEVKLKPMMLVVQIQQSVANVRISAECPDDNL